MFPSHIRHDVHNLFKKLAPRRTGNTAENALINNPIPNGFEERLLESVSPYGVKLNNAVGGWAGKRDRRTGILLKGWFTERATTAAGMLIRNKGGMKDGIGANTQSLIADSIDNPARQSQFLKSVAEGGTK